MKKLVLYSYYRSSASYRVRIALNFKQLEYDYRPVNLVRNGGEQRTHEYQTLNPSKQVPTLVDQDYVLSESMAILDYLDSIMPTPRLFPLEPRERGQVIRFCEVINSGIQPLGNLKVTQYLEEQFPGVQGMREKWIQNWVGQGLATLEQLLGKSAGTYCFGGKITAADIFLVPQVFSAERFNVDLSPYPLLSNIWKNCLKHPAFEKAHPNRQPDCPKS